MKKGIAVILITSILLVCVSCNSKTTIDEKESSKNSQTNAIDSSQSFPSSLPSAPIIGLWFGEAVVNSGEVLPITTNAYLDIKSDGKFILQLDENTNFSGEWESIGRSIENQDGELYRLKVEDDRLYLFDKDDDDKLYVLVNGEDSSIMFTFKK